MRTITQRANVARVLLAAAVALGFTQSAPQQGGSNWPAWRGPLRTGAAPDTSPPVQWSEDHNVRWKIPVPGQGSASPVIWGDRIFVATAIPSGDEPPESRSAGRRPHRFGRAAPPTVAQQFVLMALDRSDGSVIWQQSAAEHVPHEGKHPTNSFASASPLTDGTHVFAFFGSRGLYCYDMDGELIWQKDLGDMSTRLGFGEGASPALLDDTLVVAWDHEGDSFIVALDKATGEERWRRPRDEPTTWSTPLIVRSNGRAQVVTAGQNHVRSYDLATGELLWQGPGLTSNVIPSPVFAQGIVYLTSGFRGSALLAVRLAAAEGDIGTDDAIQWRRDRDTPYVPSPLLVGNNLYVIKSNNPILSNIDPGSGEPHYGPERLQGLGTIYASPVGAGGHVYILDRDGNALVLAQGPEFKVVARNHLDDGFDASPAVVGSELYLRGQRFLYRISAQ